MGFSLRDILRWFPDFRRLERHNARLRVQVEQVERERERERARYAEWMRFSPPGHFYSPLPSGEEIADAYARGGFGPPFAAVDLNEAGQFARLEKFAAYYAEQPFPEQPVAGRRFHLDNSSYGHYDAIMLYGMLREAAPRRIIEVGIDGRPHLAAADMTRLRPLLRPEDLTRCTLIERRVQEVPLEIFASLEENDVLFIDSSHVSKIGSDVNRLFFDVLPALAPGVLIHIHDVAGNLEYPRDWLEEGRAWNEQYLLRAFLMNNAAYRVELFTAWLWNRKFDFIRERMPLCARGGGGQMWLRKLAR